MINENVAIKIETDIQKYISKALELGYKEYSNQYNMFTGCYNGYYIILYNKCMSYNILYTKFEYKEMSQEEFFNLRKVIMRKKLDQEVLELLVKNTVESLNAFSIYDVTSVIRDRLPNYEINHNDIKSIVLNICKNYKQIHANGGYRMFFKPQVKTVTKTIQPKISSKTITTTTVNVGTEGRITLNKRLLNKLFHNVQKINVSTENNRILISDAPISKNDKIVLKLPTRIRTKLNYGVAKIKEISGSTKFPLYEVCN